MPVADNLGLIQIGVVQTFPLAVNDVLPCVSPQYQLVVGSEVNVTGVIIDINTGQANFTVTANGPFTFNYERFCNAISEGITTVSGTGFSCTPVIITTQPQGVVGCNIAEAVLSVVSIGSDLTYQWKVNGTDILAATSASYTANQSGSYTVTVSNLCSTETSTAAVVTFSTSPGGGSAFPPIAQVVGSSYYKSLVLTGTPPFSITTINKASWINSRVVGNFFEVYGTPNDSNIGSAEYHFRIANSCGFVSAYSVGGQVTKPCLKPIQAMYEGDDLVVKGSTTTQTVKVLGSQPFTYLHTSTGEIIGANNLETVTIKDNGCSLSLTTVITNACGSITISKTINTRRELEFTIPLEFDCHLCPYSVKVVGGDNVERYVSHAKNSITFIPQFGIHKYEILLRSDFGNIIKKYLENIEG